MGFLATLEAHLLLPTRFCPLAFALCSAQSTNGQQFRGQFKINIRMVGLEEGEDVKDREEGQLYAQRDSVLQPNQSLYGSTTVLKSPQIMVGNDGLIRGGRDAKNLGHKH